MRKLKHLKPLAVALLLAAVALATPTEAITLKPTVDIDCPVILADQSGTVYVVVQFDVPFIDFIRLDDRPDLSLAMVLDRSGSMADRGKMEYAKRAAMFVVDQMTPADKLAVVEYDDQITVLWESSPVKHRDRIKDRISRLEPRGSTNLVGGMMRGVDEVYYAMSDGGINRVLLLSDGLANRGVTDPHRIRRMVREARAKGITISTIGLGLDYNEDLMQMIAREAGGNYYFVEHPNQMRDIFDRELGTVYATVAKDVRIRFKKARPVRDVRVFGFLNEQKASDLSIDLGSIYAGEKLSMVMRIDLEPGNVGSADIGTLELEYVDVAANAPRTFTKQLAVEVSRDADKVRRSQKRDITVEATLVEADNFHEQQVRLYEEGRKDEALANLGALAAEMADRNADLGDVKIAAKLEALAMEAEQIEDAEHDPAARSGYLKKQKASLSQSQQGVRGGYVQQMGDTGYEVKQLQQVLLDKGFYAGPVDGSFTDDVAAAVKEFQKASGLKADGVAGPKTLQRLGLY